MGVLLVCVFFSILNAFLWLHQHRLWSNTNVMGLHMIIRKCRITGPTVIQNLVLLLLFRYREFLWQWLLLLKPHETDVTPTGNLRWQWFRVHRLLRTFVQDQTFPSSSSLKPFHWKDIFTQTHTHKPQNTPHKPQNKHAYLHLLYYLHSSCMIFQCYTKVNT